MTARTKHSRRRGAAMVEYVLLCGIIALLLLAAVINFKEKIRITFVGTDGNGGAAGSVNGIANNIGGLNGGNGGNGSHSSRPADLPAGSPPQDSPDGHWHWDGSSWNAK